MLQGGFGAEVRRRLGGCLVGPDPFKWPPPIDLFFSVANGGGLDDRGGAAAQPPGDLPPGPALPAALGQGGGGLATLGSARQELHLRHGGVGGRRRRLRSGLLLALLGGAPAALRLLAVLRDLNNQPRGGRSRRKPAWPT